MSRSPLPSLPALVRSMAPLAIGLSLASCQHSRAASETAAPSEGEDVKIGYATADRRDMTKPVSSLTSREIERVQVTRVEELLRQVSGVQVTRLSNGEYSVRVRGAGVSTGNNEPLYLIDGVPTSTRGSSLRVSPHDVERIDVLKGPAATIYGLRGANGVILITTKRGR